MKIYTKTGDAGTTSLYSGERVSKSHQSIDSIGTLDELTSHLGKIKSLIYSKDIELKEELYKQLEHIQKKLIIVMGIVADAQHLEQELTQNDINDLERWIDEYWLHNKAFKEFVLPGSNVISAEADIVRTVARRAERGLVESTSHKLVKQYINRLSDYLFSVARYLELASDDTAKKFGLEMANQIIERVIWEAKQSGLKVVVAIVSKEGRPISVQQMDGAFFISYDLAIKKAFSAAALQMSTMEIAKITATGTPFEHLTSIVSEEIVTLGGGYPLHVQGEVVGAIGVSGASEEEDDRLAQIALNLMKGR